MTLRLKVTFPVFEDLFCSEQLVTSLHFVMLVLIHRSCIQVSDQIMKVLSDYALSNRNLHLIQGQLSLLNVGSGKASGSKEGGHIC